MFTAALYPAVKKCKHPITEHQLNNGKGKCGKYTQWNVIQPPKGMKSCHF
jgi:hypothetical protein